jgi:hypothetical protein
MRVGMCLNFDKKFGCSHSHQSNYKLIRSGKNEGRGGFVLIKSFSTLSFWASTSAERAVPSGGSASKMPISSNALTAPASTICNHVSHRSYLLSVSGTYMFNVRPQQIHWSPSSSI